MKEALKILLEAVVFSLGFLGWVWLVGKAFAWAGVIGP